MTSLRPTLLLKRSRARRWAWLLLPLAALVGWGCIVVARVENESECEVNLSSLEYDMNRVYEQEMEFHTIHRRYGTAEECAPAHPDWEKPGYYSVRLDGNEKGYFLTAIPMVRGLKRFEWETCGWDAAPMIYTDETRETYSAAPSIPPPVFNTHGRAPGMYWTSDLINRWTWTDRRP
jgi:hypothetical protein